MLLLMLMGCVGEEIYAGEPDSGNETNMTDINKEYFTMYIKVGKKQLKADMEDNVSTKALRKQFTNGTLTLILQDYGGMEKGIYLKSKPPTAHKSLAPVLDDILLHQDNVFLIYYANNSS